MRCEAVELSDFRNYHTLFLAPAPSLNVLTGDNAQGKTNLLEAIGVLLVGRSFRGARAAELARWGAARATVRGELRRGDSGRSLRRVIERDAAGAWAVTGEGCAWARAIPFGWGDLAIVHGGPQARRNFLDGFVAKLHPAYAATYQRYRRVLARRNHLLQGGGEIESRIDPWSEQLVTLGLEILARRREGVAALRAEVSRLYPELGGRGELDMLYRTSLGEAPTTDAFREALARRRSEELRRGQTLTGPHRDDLVITLDGQDVRIFGSRGQQRLIALTLRLAEAGPVRDAVGSSPVLLLDDALSELDPGVQARVLRHVAGAGQVFLTSADAVPEVVEGRRWEVQAGHLTEAPGAVVAGAA